MTHELEITLHISEGRLLHITLLEPRLIVTRTEVAPGNIGLLTTD